MSFPSDLHIIVHVVEILLSHDSEKILLGSILNAGNELTEFPVSLIHFILTYPMVILHVETTPVTHVDEGSGIVKGVIRHALQHQLIRLAIILSAIRHAVLGPVIEFLHQWPKRQFAIARV